MLVEKVEGALRLAKQRIGPEGAIVAAHVRGQTVARHLREHCLRRLLVCWHILEPFYHLERATCSQQNPQCPVLIQQPLKLWLSYRRTHDLACFVLVPGGDLVLWTVLCKGIVFKKGW